MNRVEYRSVLPAHNKYCLRCSSLFWSKERQLTEFCSFPVSHNHCSRYLQRSLHPLAVSLRQPHIPGIGIHKSAWYIPLVYLIQDLLQLLSVDITIHVNLYTLDSRHMQDCFFDIDAQLKSQWA